jgi:hypothetical protein
VDHVVGGWGMVERAGVAGGGGTWEGGVAHRSRVLTSGDMCGVHLHPVGVDFSYGSIFDQAMVLRMRVVAMPQYTARDNSHADGGQSIRLDDPTDDRNQKRRHRETAADSRPPIHALADTCGTRTPTHVRNLMRSQ